MCNQTVVKQTSRNLRIWIEGKNLSDNGFTWKTNYTRTIENGVITMALDTAGKLRVSGRNRKGVEQSIIDISLSSGKGFKAGQVVNVTYSQGLIIIE